MYPIVTRTKILPLQLLQKNDHQKLSKNPGIFDFRHFQNFLHGSALHFHSVPPHMDRFPPHFDHFFGQKVDLPLFGDLGQTSQDLCGSISDSQESRDVCLNSSKSGFSNRLATFRRIRTNVPGSLRIDIQFAKVLGHLS